MTAQSSAGKSRFLTYFLYKLRHLRPLTILNGIFCFFSYPFAGFAVFMLSDAVLKFSKMQEESDILANEFYDLMMNYTGVWGGLTIMSFVIMSMCVFAIFLMGFFFPFSGYRYLHRKKYVDMDYSLPVSDNERFFGDILANAVSYFVPQLIAIGLGILFINLTFNMWPAPETPDFSYSIITNFISEFMWLGLLMNLIFFCSNVFLMSLSGKSITTFLSPIVINAAIPLTINAIVSLTNNFYGSAFSIDNGVITNPAFIATSPIGIYAGGFVGLFEAFGALEITTTLSLPYFSNLSFIITLVLSLTYLSASYFLMKYRRTERVGSPYVFRGVQIAIPAIATFTIVTMYGQGIFTGTGSSGISVLLGSGVGETALVVAAIIMTFIAHVIIELVGGNGFKKFHFSFLRYVGAVAASFLICWVLSISDGFGQKYYIPAVSDIKESSITSTLDNDEEILKNNHELATKLHKLALDKHYMPELSEEDKLTSSIIGSYYGSSDYDVFSVEYRLSNGSTVTRQYPVDAETAEEIRIEIINGGLYKQKYTEALDFLNSIPEKNREISITVSSSNNGYIDMDRDIDARTLLNVLLKDSETLTYDNTRTENGNGNANVTIVIKNTGTLGYSRENYSFEITRAHKNTIEYLASLGCDPHLLMPEYVAAFITQVPENYAYSFDYSPFDYFEECPTYLVDTDDEYIEKMLSVANDFYYKEDSEYVYVITYINTYDLGTKVTYIPAEFNNDLTDYFTGKEAITKDDFHDFMDGIIGVTEAL